jgi:hypothetical protein
MQQQRGCWAPQADVAMPTQTQYFTAKDLDWLDVENYKDLKTAEASTWARLIGDC